MSERIDLGAWLRAWLPGQRWFADKSRPLDDVSVVSQIPVRDAIQLLIVRADFTDREPSYYVVPLDLDTTPADATAEPQFLAWLGGVLDGSVGQLSDLSRRILVPQVPSLAEQPAKPLGLEQSNTSIRYGNDWIIKLQRRLAFGPSPELELAPLLNRWPGRPPAPTTLGSLELNLTGKTATLAVAAAFVPNLGDGWSYLLEGLRSSVEEAARADSLTEQVEALGILTADMHGALSLDPWTTDLAPERITGDDTRQWAAAITDHERRVRSLLREHRHALAGEAASLADIVLGRSTAAVGVAGLDKLVGSYMTRIHGDYHLGQVLRAPDGGFVAIDFDGEPQRPLHERRAKYSPLRDVAGMLRSFAYAAATVAMESDSKEPRRAALRAWEHHARETFLTAYMRTLRAHRPDLIPSAADDVRQAVEVLELEKAIYEVEYELNNRPAWLWLPLTQLARSA